MNAVRRKVAQIHEQEACRDQCLHSRLTAEMKGDEMGQEEGRGERAGSHRRMSPHSEQEETGEFPSWLSSSELGGVSMRMWV